MRKGIIGAVAALLLVATLWAPAYAADSKKDKEIKVRTIEMVLSETTVRVNQIKHLWVALSPHDAEDKTVYWSTSNPEIADVDQEGVVTGISPGTAEITATASSGGKKATCIVTVPGVVLQDIPLDTTNKSRTEAEINAGEVLSAATLRLQVEQAVKDAGKGQTATVTYRDKTTVSTAALRSAAFTAEYQGGQAMLKFLTTDNDGKIQGQIALDPAKAPADDRDLKVGVYTADSKVSAAREQARNTFGGSPAVVQISQSGSFGMTVRVAAKVDLAGMDTQALRLYAYNSGTDAYTLMEHPSYTVDSEGYLFFSTDRGGAVVITDQQRK